ncbi:MAG: prepilin-type N-terminal cleavage/methylation domain-containing protein [Verrucomicrobiota bacterium]
MKLTQTPSIKRKSGMTLLELTVVILVLLSLISILFIGARAWKKGADRAGCILNIRNYQLAVRSLANMKQLNPGDVTTAASPAIASIDAEVIGTGKFMEKTPKCPGGTSVAYTFLSDTTIPAVGAIQLICGNVGTLTDHVPSNTGDW